MLEGKKLGKYVHLNNRIGVVISTSGGDEEVVKDIAMHIAAMKPINISPDEVSSDLIAKEKEIWRNF